MTVLLKKNHSLQELANRYYRFEKDSEARMIYEARMKEQRDHAAWLSEAIETGLAQGRDEALRETAAKLKALGVSVEKICQATGLSAAEVEELPAQ